ncbi:MAG: autotransporter outer membrane beta-barrel domain-containing protein, partial [Verrucomicrobiales bacterium]
PFRLNDLVLFVAPESLSFTVNATPVDIDGGLQFANLQGEALLAGGRTVLNDLNNRLFNLRAGRDRPTAGSGLVSTLDGAPVAGSENPESPIAARGSGAGLWEAFTMVNFGDFELKGTGGNVDTWAPGIGVERELAPGLNLGFAASFLSSRQGYLSGLGGFDFEGPVLSAYLSRVTGDFWNDFLYSYGTYDLDSVREGLGNPAAFGSTDAESHAAQYNLGWYFPTRDESLVTGPFAGIDYFHGEINGYTETGGGIAGLIFTGQTVESLITRLGWSISKTMEMDQATVTAQARLSYERQNLNNGEAGVSAINAPSLDAAGINRPFGQDYVVAGLGVKFDFDCKVSLLLSYQGQFFRNNVQDHLGGVTFSVPF